MKYNNLKENMVLADSKNKSGSSIEIITIGIGAVLVQLNELTCFHVLEENWDNLYIHYEEIK